MAENTFNSSLQQLLSGLDSFLSTKSVIGAPITIHDTTILPLIDVSMGVGAGAVAARSADGSTGGGLGAKMSASGVLIIRNDGTVRIVSAKNADTVAKAEQQNYRLLQVADFVCSMELLSIKRTEKRLSQSEDHFFYKPQELKKTFLKSIDKKRL